MIRAVIIMSFLLPSSFLFAQTTTKQPNIIFILVDDQGYGDVGVFWQNQRMEQNLPYQRSPNLDKMASEGAIMTQNYAAAPVCAPSRASIMEGVSQGHARVRDNMFDKAIADNYTMASTLKKLGYSTAAIGKWGLMGDKKWDKDGDSWPARPRNRDFDYFFGYMRHSDGHQHYPKEGKYTGKKQVWLNGGNIADELDKCYTADLWTAVAKHWIVEHEKKDKEQPFFIYLAYETPHAVDELPTQKYPVGGGLKGGLQWIGEPHHYINTASGEIDSYIHPDYAHSTYDDDKNPATPEVPWPETYKRYAMANRRIDDGVGDLLKLLKDLKIDSNTVVIYTSDNGPSIESYLGKWQKEEESRLPTFFDSYGPFDGIKRDSWEGGMRMPSIAVWPGHIPARKVVNTPGVSYDWAPTFLDMTGTPAPERMDGISLLPSLSAGSRTSQQKALIYSEYYHNGKTPDFEQFAPGHRGRIRKQMQLLRIGDYVGVRYNIQSAEDDFEIYDVVKDPEEIDNLALEPGKKVNVRGFYPPTLKISHIKDLQEYMKSRVLQVRISNPANHRPYDSTLIPSVQIKAKKGIRWKFFPGNFSWIPQIDELHSEKEGKTDMPEPERLSFDSDGVLYFSGYLNVPEDGKYTFYLKAGDKAFFRIHDIQVIDADYDYQGEERKTSLFLKKGLHPFRMYYMKRKDVKPSLDLEWSGPDMERATISKDFYKRS